MATGEPVNVNEFQILAKQLLPKMYYDFYSGENIAAFQRIRFRPRIPVDVCRIEMSTTILGFTISAPILIAPTAMHKLAHPEGEIATARAAAASNTIMVYKRRDIAATLVHRAEKNGYKAIVLTVDTPKYGRREADIKNRLTVPQLKILEGLLSIETDKGSGLEAFNETLDSDVGWLKYITNMPILIKGVLSREDAMKAMEIGVAGIMVLNHGARQLDYTPATISALEEVVGGKLPVLVDGGIRRGTDIFKALALGAQAILGGRPVIYGLAVKGERGVRQVMKMLKDELELTMALSGCPILKDITRNHVRTERERLYSML